MSPLSGPNPNQKCNFEHKSGAITVRSFHEIYPSTIPNKSLLVSTHMQSLKKIGQKLLKLESGNEKNAIFNLNQGP